MLLRQLGQGAAGAVFEAEDTWVGRRVALKVLHPHVALYPDVMWRFRREARAAASIDHPNIVAVLEVGQRRDGTYYIVQELLEGMSLRQHLREHAPLPVLDALAIMVPIMGALVAAHRKEIIHRDIKPENILLATGAAGEITPKLIDFGIARMHTHESDGEHDTATGVLLGTPSYMSPEQAQGAPIDTTTDIWAVGAVLYELLAGTRPFTASSAALVVEKIRTEPPVPITTHLPELHRAIVDLVHQALARDPLDRFASMQALLRAALDYAASQDPGFIQRHVRSLPPYLGAPPSEWPALDPELDEDVRTSATPPFTRSPLVRPELEWHEDRDEPAFESVDAQAETALRVNALDDAIALAEQALREKSTARPHLLGRMRLVQAVANRWLGHYTETERCAREARADLPHGNASWFAATGHLALAAGYLGRNETVNEIATDLADMQPAPTSRAAFVKTTSQVVVVLIRAGGVALAGRLVDRARATSFELPYGDPSVHAWLDQASSELAMHAGDPTTFLRLVESAVEGFAEAGDARNAALQRANIGTAYMQLGAFTRAARVLRQAIVVAEPMKLSFLAPVKANLGMVLARLGELDAGISEIREAIEGCVAQSYRRFEGVSRVYLAEALILRGELEAAEDEIRRALAVSVASPATHAHALATLAQLLLQRRDAAGALPRAEEAMRLLSSAVGVEEGEARIRLVHARALAAAGRHEEAAAAARVAQDRLQERAALIADSRYRRSFLRDVPENAATAALAIDAGA